MRYLKQQQLQGFETYKYSCIDTCILSKYVMHPFWNWCVQFCPIWIAPNLLTFAGLVLTAFNFALLSWYDFHFYGNSEMNPSRSAINSHWLWAVVTMNMFLAYTLDGIDGKQARRTGTSGPLGELFDHGVDSYTSILIPTTLYSVYGRQVISPFRMFFLIWLVFNNFFVTHFEKYITGVMFLPWGYDFTMVSVVLMLFLTSVLGPDIWHIRLPYDFPIGLALEIILYSSAITTSYTIVFWNIYKSYRDKTGKMKPLSDAMAPLVPYLSFFIISTLWAAYSPNDILNHEPRIFYLLLGTVFSNISCRLIVAQMSNTKSELFNALLYPYLVVVAFILTFQIYLKVEITLLYLLTTILTIIHLHYGVCVVRDLCDHFKIQCFKVTKTSSE